MIPALGLAAALAAAAGGPALASAGPDRGSGLAAPQAQAAQAPATITLLPDCGPVGGKAGFQVAGGGFPPSRAVGILVEAPSYSQDAQATTARDGTFAIGLGSPPGAGTYAVEAFAIASNLAEPPAARATYRVPCPPPSTSPPTRVPPGPGPSTTPTTAAPPGATREPATTAGPGTTGAAVVPEAASLTLAPTVGEVGSTVALVATGIDAPCEVAFDGEVALSGDACQPDPSGVLRAELTVPARQPGERQVIVVGLSARGDLAVARAPFTVVACDPQPRMLRLGPTPGEGRPGTSFVVSGTWAQVPEQCAGLAATLRFLGREAGEVMVGEDFAGMAVDVPDDAPAGASAIDVVPRDGPPVVLGSASFAVLDDGGGGFPWAPVGAAVATGAVLGAAALRRKGAGGTDPCPGPRRRLEKAQAEAERARGEADAAQQEARAAEDRARSPSPPAPPAPPEAGTGPEPGPRTEPLLPPVVPGPGSYYLLDHENPHAWQNPNGKRGWYRAQRTEPLRGVVVHAPGWVTGASSAGAVASELAVAPRPRSAHVAIDGDGCVDLLPPDAAAFHTLGGEEATVAVAVAEWGTDPERDERVLGHLAHWLGALGEAHRVPLVRRSPEEIRAGEAGIAYEPLRGTAPPGGAEGAAPDPVERLLAPAGDPGPGATLAVAALGGLLAGTLGRGPAGPAPAPASSPAAAEAERARARAREAEARAREAEDRAREARAALDECACKDVGDLGRLVEDEDDGEGRGFYLLDHPNPSAPARADGRSGWYDVTRNGPIRGIVVHTAESLVARGVAQYLAATPRAAAAHVVVDAVETVPLLPDAYKAFHAGPRGNSPGLGIEIAYEAARWGSNPPDEELRLARSALWCARKAVLHDIPVVRVAPEDWDAGGRGFISHAELMPAERTDPGPDFPWERFLDMVRRLQPLLGGPGAAGTPS